MNPRETRSRLKAAADKLAEDIVKVLSEAFADAAGAPAVTVAPPSQAEGISAPRAPTSETPAGEIEAGLVEALGRSGTGLRAEELCKVLGTTSKQLGGPVANLLGAGKLRKEGKARGTRYFLS